MIDNEKRNREILALRDCGKSYSQIGIQFGLSPSRIKQIYDKEKKHMESKKIHIGALNGEYPYTFYDAILEVCDTDAQATRIFRCLSRSGIISEIERNYGSLDSYSDETLLDIRNFGSKSLYFARKANEVYKQQKESIRI